MVLSLVDDWKSVSRCDSRKSSYLSRVASLTSPPRHTDNDDSQKEKNEEENLEIRSSEIADLNNNTPFSARVTEKGNTETPLGGDEHLESNSHQMTPFSERLDDKEITTP